ncbi:MAG: hypothetical protein K1X85_03355 [Ignavibacteria bacterium]|nr:hypothetical protein [Ignavibacteria bacterium]
MEEPVVTQLEETKPKRKLDSTLAKIMLALIILATIFSIYMTVKLFIHGFTFR